MKHAYKCGPSLKSDAIKMHCLWFKFASLSKYSRMSSLMFVYNLSVTARNDLITEPNIIIIALWIVQNIGVPKINWISFHRASTIHKGKKGREGARPPVFHDFRCSISVLAFPRSELLSWTVWYIRSECFKKNGTP